MHVQFLNQCIIYYVKPNKKFRRETVLALETFQSSPISWSYSSLEYFFSSTGVLQ
jgi:hypothetical protein